MTEGKDGVYIGWEVFSEYARHGALIAKRMVQHALDLLLGEGKTLETSLGAQGVATLMEQEGRYISHLLYAVPVKRGGGVEVIEDITPVHDVAVRLRPLSGSIWLPRGRRFLLPKRTGLWSSRWRKSAATRWWYWNIKYLLPPDGGIEVSSIRCHQIVVWKHYAPTMRYQVPPTITNVRSR